MLKRDRRTCGNCDLGVCDACMTRWMDGKILVVCSCPVCHPPPPQTTKVEFETLLKSLKPKG